MAAGLVLANRNHGHTIYTMVIPQQDYPYGQCECTFETWITLRGSTVHVRSRLTNFRDDGQSFTAHGQEPPALYTTGDAYRLYTYDGDAPYTGAPMREITDDQGGFFAPGQAFLATEHWAALVDDDGYGVGLFEPHVTRFGGIPGNEYAIGYGWISGYLSAFSNEILSASTVYTYDYSLVQLSVSTDPATFAHQDVTVAFDNFRVVRGRVSCPWWREAPSSAARVHR